jgi:hypothetical protein
MGTYASLAVRDAAGNIVGYQSTSTGAMVELTGAASPAFQAAQSAYNVQKYSTVSSSGVYQQPGSYYTPPDSSYDTTTASGIASMLAKTGGATGRDFGAIAVSQGFDPNGLFVPQTDPYGEAGNRMRQNISLGRAGGGNVDVSSWLGTNTEAKRDLSYEGSLGVKVPWDRTNYPVDRYGGRQEVFGDTYLNTASGMMTTFNKRGMIVGGASAFAGQSGEFSGGDAFSNLVYNQDYANYKVGDPRRYSPRSKGNYLEQELNPSAYSSTGAEAYGGKSLPLDPTRLITTNQANWWDEAIASRERVGKQNTMTTPYSEEDPQRIRNQITIGMFPKGTSAGVNLANYMNPGSSNYKKGDPSGESVQNWELKDRGYDTQGWLPRTVPKEILTRVFTGGNPTQKSQQGYWDATLQVLPNPDYKSNQSVSTENGNLQPRDLSTSKATPGSSGYKADVVFTQDKVKGSYSILSPTFGGGILPQSSVITQPKLVSQISTPTSAEPIQASSAFDRAVGSILGGVNYGGDYLNKYVGSLNTQPTKLTPASSSNNPLTSGNVFGVAGKSGLVGGFVNPDYSNTSQVAQPTASNIQTTSDSYTSPFSMGGTPSMASAPKEQLNYETKMAENWIDTAPVVGGSLGLIGSVPFLGSGLQQGVVGWQVKNYPTSKMGTDLFGELARASARPISTAYGVTEPTYGGIPKQTTGADYTRMFVDSKGKTTQTMDFAKGDPITTVGKPTTTRVYDSSGGWVDTITTPTTTTQLYETADLGKGWTQQRYVKDVKVGGSFFDITENALLDATIHKITPENLPTPRTSTERAMAGISNPYSLLLPEFQNAVYHKLRNKPTDIVGEAVVGYGAGGAFGYVGEMFAYAKPIAMAGGASTKSYKAAQTLSYINEKVLPVGFYGMIGVGGVGETTAWGKDFDSKRMQTRAADYTVATAVGLSAMSSGAKLPTRIHGEKVTRTESWRVVDPTELATGGMFEGQSTPRDILVSEGKASYLQTAQPSVKPIDMTKLASGGLMRNSNVNAKGEWVRSVEGDGATVTRTRTYREGGVFGEGGTYETTMPLISKSVVDIANFNPGNYRMRIASNERTGVFKNDAYAPSGENLGETPVGTWHGYAYERTGLFKDYGVLDTLNRDISFFKDTAKYPRDIVKERPVFVEFRGGAITNTRQRLINDEVIPNREIPNNWQVLELPKGKAVPEGFEVPSGAPALLQGAHNVKTERVIIVDKYTQDIVAAVSFEKVPKGEYNRRVASDKAGYSSERPLLPESMDGSLFIKSLASSKRGGGQILLDVVSAKARNQGINSLTGFSADSVSGYWKSKGASIAKEPTPDTLGKRNNMYEFKLPSAVKTKPRYMAETTQGEYTPYPGSDVAAKPMEPNQRPRKMYANVGAISSVGIGIRLPVSQSSAVGSVFPTFEPTSFSQVGTGYKSPRAKSLKYEPTIEMFDMNTALASGRELKTPREVPSPRYDVSDLFAGSGRQVKSDYTSTKVYSENPFNTLAYSPPTSRSYSSPIDEMKMMATIAGKPSTRSRSISTDTEQMFAISGIASRSDVMARSKSTETDLTNTYGISRSVATESGINTPSVGVMGRTSGLSGILDTARPKTSSTSLIQTSAYAIDIPYTTTTSKSTSTNDPWKDSWSDEIITTKKVTIPPPVIPPIVLPFGLPSLPASSPGAGGSGKGSTAHREVINIASSLDFFSSRPSPRQRQPRAAPRQKMQRAPPQQRSISRSSIMNMKPQKRSKKGGNLW